MNRWLRRIAIGLLCLVVGVLWFTGIAAGLGEIFRDLTPRPR